MSNKFQKFYIFIFFISLFILYIHQIFYLQIIEGANNYESSIYNQYSKSVIQPDRGLIYDVDMNLIVDNKDEYWLLIDNSFDHKYSCNADLLEIKKVLEIEDDVQYIDVINGKVLVLDVEDYNLLEELDIHCPAISLVKGVRRLYPSEEYLSHILGYIGLPEEDDLKSGINPVIKVGKYGLEEYYDEYLRGGEGVVLKKGDGEEGYIFKKEEKGNDIVMTIDSDWQRLLYKIIQKSVESEGYFGGGGLIMDSENGAIKAMVSYPSFNLNEFVDFKSSDYVNNLFKDPRTPLLNRVIGVSMHPGSTFKLGISAAGLEDGLIDIDEKFYSEGCMTLGGDIQFCEADGRVWGELVFNTALSRSSNLYFCNVAKTFNEKYGEQNGIQYLNSYLDNFQFNKVTGIDLNGEVVSSLAKPGRIERLNNRLWSIGDMCNSVIGQGDVLVTPIRMGVMVSSIVNGGEVIEPFLVKKVENTSGGTIFVNTKTVVGDNGISDSNLKIIYRGMRNVVIDEYGSGHELVKYLDSYNLRLKTGSADTAEILSDGKYVSGAHSWVVGVFSYEGRDYSVVLFQQYAGRGYKTIPILGKFLSCLSEDFVDNCEESY